MSSAAEKGDGEAHEKKKPAVDTSLLAQARHRGDAPAVHPALSSNDRAQNFSLHRPMVPSVAPPLALAPSVLSDAMARYDGLGVGQSYPRLPGASVSTGYPQTSLGRSLHLSNMSHPVNAVLLGEAINAPMSPSVALHRYPREQPYTVPSVNAVRGLSDTVLLNYPQLFSDPRLTSLPTANIPETRYLPTTATGPQINNSHGLILPSRNNLTDPSFLRDLSLQSHLSSQRRLLEAGLLNRAQQSLRPPALPYSYQRVLSNRAASAQPSSAMGSPLTGTAVQLPSPATLASAPSRQTADILQRQQSPRRNKRKYTHENFPSRLHRLLREASERGNGHICRFTSDGTQFQILNTKAFEDRVLPNYFRHGRIDSFKRLLRMYEFKRVDGTWMQGTFEHPMFHRDAPELCPHMERKEKKE